ncbi:MAG: ABC-three component system protein [Clostridiaceae bacterium]
MPNKTLVPDKLQGYLLQVKHMLYELISVDYRVVSVEKLDDVAVEIDEKVIAEQVKSVTSTNNPIAERSSVFWKTLYNWCTYIEDGSLPSEAVLRFVVVANGTITPGGIQESFKNAHSDAEAQKALTDAKTAILGTPPDDPTADVYAALPDTYRDYVKYLFDGGRTKTVCDIIKAMEIEIHNDTYDEDLLKRFSNQTIPAEYADLLLTDMLGWVTRTVESFTKDNKPAYIAAKDYREALNIQIRASDTKTILRAVSRVPSNAEQSGEVERLDTYIRQLKLIEMDDTTLYEAASDFLRTKVDKIEWAQRGIVNAQSFDDYHDALFRTWTNRKQLMGLQYGTDPIACGKAVYFNCRDDSGRQKLQGVEAPPFFGSGSLQGLANDPADAPRIGWHPQYMDLLKGGSV